MMFFRCEWLSLPKDEFRMLVMIVDIGENIGNLSAMCRYFGLNQQSKTKERLKNALYSLNAKGLINLTKNGNSYSAVLPNESQAENGITIDKGYVIKIKKHEYTRSVAWENVLKVYIWLCLNANIEFTNSQISSCLEISESTIIEAKHVLRDYGAVEIEYINVIKGEKIYRTGQIACPSAFWNEDV